MWGGVRIKGDSEPNGKDAGGVREGARPASKNKRARERGAQ
jgi:hypothetical protein